MSDVRLHIDEAEFADLLDLVNSQPWLKSKKRQLFDLLAECPTPDHKKLIIGLLQRAFYIDSSAYFSSINAIHNQIENVWKLDPKSTFFVSSNHEETTDSSQEVLNQLKSCEWASSDWHSKQFFTRYKDVVAALRPEDIIIIVDDFIGGGGTMIKALDWFRSKTGGDLATADIRVVSVSACEGGFKNIADTGTKIYVRNIIPKAISSHFAGNDLEKAVVLMNQLEDILAASLQKKKTLSKYRFGWERQEAVFFRQGGNTPNNVFPIMWWRNVRGGSRRTIMNRTN